MPKWFALTGGNLRQCIFAVAMLASRAPRTNGKRIHSPSFQFLPHFMHVSSHPYHGVKKQIIRVRRLQSGHISALICFAVAFGLWRYMLMVVSVEV